MAKKLICVIVGLLVASAAHAVPVDPDHSSGIVAVKIRTVLCSDGTVWEFGTVPPEWTHLQIDPVPAPIAEIREWNITNFFTHSGSYWNWDGEEWVEYAYELPCSIPVGSENESLDDLKARFR